MNAPALEIKEVSTATLKNINIKLAKGDFAAIIAPSGSGKSDLLSLICGVKSFSSGQILVNGDDIHRIKEMAIWRAASIGFIFEEHNLIPSLTVYENVALPMAAIGVDKEKRKERVDIALDRVGLREKERFYPKKLTMQEEQMAALARAIVYDQSLVLADEPTGKMNAVQTKNFIGLIGDLNQASDNTFLVVSHDHEWKQAASNVLDLVP